MIDRDSKNATNAIIASISPLANLLSLDDRSLVLIAKIDTPQVIAINTNAIPIELIISLRLFKIANISHIPFFYFIVIL